MLCRIPNPDSLHLPILSPQVCLSGPLGGGNTPLWFQIREYHLLHGIWFFWWYWIYGNRFLLWLWVIVFWYKFVQLFLQLLVGFFVLKSRRWLKTSDDKIVSFVQLCPHQSLMPYKKHNTFQTQNWNIKF